MRRRRKPSYAHSEYHYNITTTTTTTTTITITTTTTTTTTFGFYLRRCLQLRFDSDSTAIRPRYDHSTTYVTTVISCKYENRQRLQFTTEFAKTTTTKTLLFYQVCADTVKAKRRRRLCLFCPSNKLTFDLLILKVVSESRVTWATSVSI